MKQPLFVSFYTEDYTQHAKQLMSSLETFHYEYEVVAVDDKGRWQLNCCEKPKFIWNQMAEHPDRGIIWLDADCKVIQEPKILTSTTNDFAACEYVWPSGKAKEVLSGTLLFNPTKNARILLDRWIEQVDEFPDRWDQKSLQAAIEQVPDLKWTKLPVDYAYIATRHEREFPNVSPVIFHYQRSRYLRQKGLKQ